jgi:predicted transcriptional regulator
MLQTMQIPRSTLYALVDALPPTKLATAREVLEALARGDSDNDALTSEEEAILQLRLEQARTGQVVDAEEVFEDLDRIIEEAERAQ